MDPAATAAVFNVTDDEPAASHEVTEHAAKLLGVSPPPRQDFDTAELSATVPSPNNLYATYYSMYEECVCIHGIYSVRAGTVVLR